MTHYPVYLYKKVRVSIYLDQLSLNSNENRKNVYVVYVAIESSDSKTRARKSLKVTSETDWHSSKGVLLLFHWNTKWSPTLLFLPANPLHNTQSIPPTQRYEINQGLVLLVGHFDLASFVLITNQMYFDLRCSVILEITWGLVLNWVLVPFCPYPFLQTLSISINWLIWLPVTNRPAQLHFRWLFHFVSVDKMG